jgi:hypothetical protein
MFWIVEMKKTGCKDASECTKLSMEALTKGVTFSHEHVQRISLEFPALISLNAKVGKS